MLYTIAQIRQIEQAALATLEPGTLMRIAGQAAAQTALKLLNKPNQSILVFAGPGNNGGDALEAAVHLANAEHNVFVLHHPPTSPMSPDTQQVFDLAQACTQITWLESGAFLENSFALVIDGLFGIGLKQQSMSAVLQRQIEEINILHCHTSFPILALDVPSGLDADTGNLVSNVAIQASHTITFIGDKPGLHTGNGRDYAGKVEVADLGIAKRFYPASDIEQNHVGLFSDIFVPRRQNSNKASYGIVAIIGGALGMQGAAILAARAALYSGAGRVFAGFIESPPAFDALQPELMCRKAEQVSIQDATVTVIGPGLGQSSASLEMLRHTLQNAQMLVIDADALNLMAQHPELFARCNSRPALSTLLTPHPLEAARLLGCSVEEVQKDRVAAAKKIAQEYSALVILKGSGSVLAHPIGQIVINTTGNAALATGGTGDVLAGVCGSLAAQHHNLWQAALAATWLHGAAVDNLVAQHVGPVGVCAGELLVEIRRGLNTKPHYIP
jgi:hydroxyethylthiazole kinase-like uncharacterized protein yjeF